MRKINRTLMIAGILSVAALWPRSASADPPGRVGRLSYVEGTVSARTGNQDQWNNAVLNVPVTTGDGYWTENDGRTEIQIGGMEIRTDHDTELDINKLDDDSTVLEVPQGMINVHIAEMPAGGITVMTPAGETKLNEPGIYRIDAGQPQGNEPGSTEVVAVVEGGAMFTGPRASINIDAGEQAVLNGNPPSAGIERLATSDFDNWAASRNRPVLVSTRERRHVPVQVTGYQDLDRYGNWESDPEYGEVWYPEDISADWAPYREGYWSYVEPWGWTWIDNEPWGFAPYHYGRWVHRQQRWGWYPGRYHEAQPVYAPALVAFVGGRNWGVSLSLGESEPVGWVPLAPDEPFYPYYRTSDRYRVNINRTTVNKTVINNIVVNNNGTINTTGGTLTAARFANRDAVTVVRGNDFRRGARADRVAVKVSESAITSAPAATVAAIQPTQEARGGRGAARANGLNRHAPSPPERSAWREQRRQNRLNAQQPATGVATPSDSTAAPAATNAPATAPAAPNTANQATTAVPHQLNTAAQRREQRQLERQERAEERGRPERRGPHEAVNRHAPAAEAETAAKPETEAAPTPAAATPAQRTESAVEREQVQPQPQTQERRSERMREPPIASRSADRNEDRAARERKGLAEPLIEPSAGPPRNPRAEHGADREARPAAQERDARGGKHVAREKDREKDKEDKKENKVKE